MTRIFGNRQVICWMLLFALLTSTLALPIYSKTNSPTSDLAQPKPHEGQSTLEPKEPVDADPKVEASIPTTPEELRQAEIEADTRKLYQLAAELRAEVAKTYKDSLSLNVIKKAEELEKLAKSLKARMSKEAAASKR